MPNVRITVDEALDGRRIVRTPDQRRSINRLGQSTREYEITTAMGVPSER